jgi:16S rRNA C1402 N4-methylase RsmH
MHAALAVAEGDTVVDATAGNGNDTLFLAEKVGSSGQVFAFDIQSEALAVTEERLKQSNLITRVTLIRAGHEELAKYVSNSLSVIMYNLGYLPGGNKQITTEYNSLATSLEQAMVLLKPGGVITIVLYPGHDSGKIEKEKLLSICELIPSSAYAVLYSRLVNQAGDPPELIVIQKRLFTIS